MKRNTQADIDFLTMALMRKGALVPINRATAKHTVNDYAFRCTSLPGQTTRDIAEKRSIDLYEDSFFKLDLQGTGLKRHAYLGLVEMDVASTTEQVTDFVQKLGHSLADYQDFLAALQAEGDPLRGEVVVVPGSHLLDSEGRKRYPRHIALWEEERNLRLEYQNCKADSASTYNLNVAKSRPGFICFPIGVPPDAWPVEYRFLVRLKDHA